MKLLQAALVALVFLVNLAIAQPTWADPPNLTQSPEYTEVTQTLTSLLQAKAAPKQAGYDAGELQQKIGELQLQKYILETAADWGQCRNETGKTLGVYAHKPLKKAAFSSDQSTLYYLPTGAETDDDWNCDGVLLPTGVKVAGLDEEGLTEPLVAKLVAGTQLLATTNPDTGAVELNVPPAKVLKAGEGTWTIPSLSQTEIDAQAPNAPIED
ncbi:hypothetical protein IFO70_20410 [Phormidium tenue FACHB-886]|nr:hypothetical protein [Phormidium tenue FACHB-886]